MDNSQFLNVLKHSFMKYLDTGARSNEKLKILHGAISEDLSAKLQAGKDTMATYSVASLGFKTGREGRVKGRYVDKTVDITVSKDGLPISSVAVKFVMSNYMQNSNNYFENMLGETANIRCNGIPYFQIFVIPDKVPYFDISRKITKWESINDHNLEKYITLSKDNIESFMHTPNKLLIFIVSFSSDSLDQYSDWDSYKAYYKSNDFTLKLSDKDFKFGNAVVYNDYEAFTRKIVHIILGL